MEAGPEILIEAGNSKRRYWRDIWSHRELLLILTWRDLVVRYKQTIIGIGWALLQPSLQILILVLVFGSLARLPAPEGVPYPLLVVAGMLPWQFCAAAFANCGTSIISNANLVGKVFFPRVLLPASAILVSVADLLVTFLILLVVMLWYGAIPGLHILTLPFFVALAVLTVIGPGLLVSALTAQYRDFRYVVPFIVQFGLYLSPVGFSSELVRERFGELAFSLYSLNPMVGVIEGFRWALFGGGGFAPLQAITLSILVSAVLLTLGIGYFRRVERRFADVI